MEFFGQTGEAIIVMVLSVVFIFCTLILLHVIVGVYGRTLRCVKDKLKSLISSIWR